MSNHYFIILCLLALYSCIYKPMTQKTFDFGKDVCYYKDVSHNLNFEYVKPCESGKACTDLSDSNYNVKKCLNSEFLPRTLNDDCNFDEDCPGTLICTSKKCSFDGDNAYNGYCPEGKVYDRTINKCKEKTYGNMCEKKDDDGNVETDYDDNNTPIYFRICGLIELKKKTENNVSDHYFKKSVSKVFYGSAPDDSFVTDQILCESGFALYFYGNKEYKSKNNPTGNDNHEMFLRCVTVTGIDTENNIIKYRISNGDEQFYHVEDLTDSESYKDDINHSINELTMTQLEIFQNYKKRYDEIKEECKSLLYLDEQETCRDDELRKWFYFYEHPEKYILYQNEPQVMEYLIQEKYKDYKAEHTTDSIGFLKINILLIFFILISL